MLAQAWRWHVGHVREQTYGTTGSGAAVYMPVLSWDEWEDDRERILDSAARGVPSKDFFVYDGVHQGRTGYTWYAYPDNLGRFFKEMLPAEVVTQTSAGALGVHVFGSSDAPPSATLYDYYGTTAAERRWHGAQQEKMELKFDANSGAMTMKTVYRSYALSTGIPETTVAYTSQVPFRGWMGGLTLAGATNNRLLGATLSFQREVNLIFAGNNSQNPIAREVGPLEITGQFSFYGGTSSGGSTDTEYTLYRNNTSTSFSLAFFDPTGSSSMLPSLTFTASNANFYPAKIDRGGNYSRWDVSMRALHNTADSGPAILSLAISSTAVTT